MPYQEFGKGLFFFGLDHPFGHFVGFHPDSAEIVISIASCRLG